MHIASLKAKMLIYPACNAEITLFLAKKVIIPTKYLDFADVFSKKLAAKLSKQFKINKPLINLKTDK